LLSISCRIIFVHRLAHRGLTVICGWSALCVYCEQTRNPSYRWQTHATRKPAKIAPIWRAYNVVANNTGLSSCI